MKKPRTSLFKAVLFVSAVTLFACNKSTDDNEPISALNVVNAFPHVPAVDFYFNGQQVNVNPFEYKKHTGYFNIYPGTKRVKVVNDQNSGQIIANADYDFPTGYYISLFIAPKNETETDSAVFVVKIDSLAQTEAGKASIRFVNLTPGLRKLDVAVKGSQQPLFTNLAFKTVTDFTTVNPSSGYILQISETGNGNPVKLETSSFAVDAGKIYTIYSSGLWDGTGTTAFGVNVIRNY